MSGAPFSPILSAYRRKVLSMPNPTENVRPDASAAPSDPVPTWLIVLALGIMFLMFVFWLVGKLMILVLGWLAFSSIGGICAAESRKMRRSRH